MNSKIDCARLKGHSVVICRCRTADGFLPCPDEARGVLTETFPPIAYSPGYLDPVDDPQVVARHLTASEQKVMHRALQSSTQLIATGADDKRPPSLSLVGGYTGSICDQCGGTRMRRSGTCETCDDCGNAGGCG